MSNIKYWSTAKKLDYCERLGKAIANNLFKEFGPNGNPSFRGPRFKYPETLYSMVHSQALIQAGLHDISKFENKVAEAADKEIRNLVNEVQS